MNDPEVFSDPCAICKKRKATRLCDYVIRYDHNITFFCDYSMLKKEVEEIYHETCDLPLCEECARTVNKVDFCPHHYKLLDKAELPPGLKKYQIKQKVKMSGLLKE